MNGSIEHPLQCGIAEIGKPRIFSRHVSGTSFGGCGYVSVGKNPHATRFGLGATPDKAFDDCKSLGFDCNPPKGGCTSLDD